ncbi:retrovirus-related pol polyprotein from transposon TNT 1-94, partial [Tanacetum coccineum]
VIRIVLWIVYSGCSKHKTRNLKLLRNFVEKFIGTIRFGNDYFASITGYEDYGEDLLTGSRDSNLYTISISKMAASSLVCLMSKATSTKSWLWHCRLSHLNFGSINHLTKQDLVDGLPRFKYDKDHCCSACEQGKSKKNKEDNGNHSCEDHEGPQIVPSLEELIANDLIIPVSNDNTDEFVQEDIAKLDGNTFINPFRTHTKTHPIEQVIGDPSKPVMTRRRLHTNAEMCMYVLIVITKEPTNIKEVMLDHNLIGSMQDELNEFKRLDVWELVERPIDRNIIKVKWL